MILKNLHISHLTGRATVHENQLLRDLVTFDRPRRTIKQMFFQPFESKEEFIFCARATFLPMFLIGVAISNPVILVTVPLSMSVFVVGAILVGGLNDCVGNKQGASMAYSIADHFLTSLLQTIINILVLPLSALVMLTRGISTGLHAANICGEPVEPAVPSPI